MHVLLKAFLTHLYLCSVSMAIAMALAIPLGVAIARMPYWRHLFLSIASVSQTIPSIAALALLIPILGIGTPPTLVVLALYALYPLIKNTVVGLLGVPEESIEAAEALGLSRFERLRIVELPLAMPTIVAGIRIATAMTIGIATIAAFIGAGGLGDFITQGLALNNMRLVLLGAIPAALLALGADFSISLLEKNLYKPFSKIIFAIAGLALSVLLILNYVGKNLSENPHKITIASKNFTEQFILAEIMAQLLEAKTKLRVERKLNLGTTDMLHRALLSGEVDLVAEYSGTAYLNIMHKEPISDSEAMLSEIHDFYSREFSLVWLTPFGFNNSQSLAMSRGLADKYKLKTLSDLALVAPKLNLGAPAEFMKRADAFVALNKIYGLNFKSVKQMDPNLMYDAIAHEKVDLIVAFLTDGRLKKWDLVTLEDDKKFAPAYEAAPIIRQQILLAYPEIGEVLGILGGLISNEVMTKLNAEVELNNLTPAQVAKNFLQQQALVN